MSYKPNGENFSKLQLAIREWIEGQEELAFLQENEEGLTGVPLGPDAQPIASTVALFATQAAIAVIGFSVDVAESVRDKPKGASPETALYKCKVCGRETSRPRFDPPSTQHPRGA